MRHFESFQTLCCHLKMIIFQPFSNNVLCMWNFEHKNIIKNGQSGLFASVKKGFLARDVSITVVSCICFKSTCTTFQNYLWGVLLLLGLSNAQRSNTNFDFFGSFEPQPQQQQRPPQQQQPRGRVEPEPFDQESKVKTTTPVPILQQINE